MLEFRHDRILEFFVAGALSTMLADAAPIDPSAWDPFFTLFLGRAVAGNICSEIVLDEIVMNNPVALVAAIPYLGNGDAVYAQLIKDRVGRWLQSEESVSPYVRDYSLSGP